MNDDPLLPAVPPIDQGLFRQVVGRFATGVTVVSTVVDGVDHATTVNAFTSVSLDPLLVLVCLDRASRLHAMVLESGIWAVSVLGEGQAAASDRFASRGRSIEDRFDGLAIGRGPVTGAAILAGAPAWLECRTHAVHDGGDHSIVVGEVLSMDLPEPDGRPLVFHEGRYRAIA